MAGTLLGTMMARLTLEDQSFVTPLRKARKDIADTETDFKKMAAGIQRTGAGLKNIMAGFIGGLAFGGIEAAIQGGLDYASSLKEVADQLGVTTTTLQEYRYVATQTGVSQEEMDRGLQKLSRTIGEAASGGKAQAAAFAALGVSFRDANGHIRTTDAIMPELVRAFSAIEDPATRAKLAVALFGKAGQQLMPLLSAGTGEVDRLRDAAHRLGVVLDEDAIQKADQTADELASLSQVLKANISREVAKNADSILMMANALTSLAGGVSSFMSTNPRLALSIIGALAGSRVGPIGAAAGALGGVALGNALDQAGKDASSDLKVRKAELQKAREAYRAAKQYRPRLSATRDGIAAPVTQSNLPAAKAEYQRQIDLMKAWVAGAKNVGATTKAVSPLDDDTLAAYRDATKSSGGGAKRRSEKSSGPTLKERLERIDQAILPDETERQRLEDQMKTLGEALAAKALDPAEYERRAVIIREKLASIGTDDEGQRLIDKLMPEQAEVTRLEAELSRLDRDMAAGLVKDPVLWQAARDRLSGQYRIALEDARAAIADPEGAIPAVDIDRVLSTTTWAEDWKRQVEGARGANDNLRQSFEETVEGISYSLRRLADDMRGGDFFDVITSIANIAMQLGGAGVFGKNIAARVNGGIAGARASGGPVLPGRSYLVGERGPEILRMGSRGGGIVPNDQIGGAAVVQLVVGEGQTFEPRVIGISGNVSVQTVRNAQRTAALRGRQRYA